MASHVDPIVARRGEFLKSFPAGQYKEMLEYCDQTEVAMAKHRILNRVIVYTRVPRWSRKGGDSWQVFIIRDTDR